MTHTLTYQELQQLIVDKLHKEVEFSFLGNNILKATLHYTFKKIVTIHVDSSAELSLAMYGNDLYIDYKLIAIENVKKGIMSGLIDGAKHNLIYIVLSYFQSQYPQYNDVVEKVTNADRIRIHLEAIPRLRSLLKHVTIESISPQEDSLQILTKFK